MPKVYLSIGCNIDRHRNILSSVRHLERLYSPLTLSSVYQSAAIGFEGADFYNMVAGFETELPLERVQASLREIEDLHGRERNNGKFSSRPLDIDLLLFGDLVRHTAEFDIPRMEIRQYAFVLLPLNEIAADLIHPETGEPISRMWQEFDAMDQPIKKIEFEFH